MGSYVQKSFWAAWLVVAGWLNSGSTAAAAAPVVAFDVPALVAVQDVTSPEFATLNPGEKLVQVVWRVSALVKRGDESDVDEIVVTLESPERRGRVIDYWPRTELQHDVIGPIQSSNTAQQHTAFKLNVVGGWLGAGSPANGNFDASQSKQLETKEQFQRLPPRTAVLASGTTHQGHGVFFKLRRWSQSSLEGDHEFRVLFAVPQAWRGDWMLFTAAARGVDRNLFGAQPVDAGDARTAVGLHLEADVGARQTVERLVSLHRQMSIAPAGPRLPEIFVSKSNQIREQRVQQSVAESLRSVRTLAGRK